MCAYEENIKAAENQWSVGNVIKFPNAGTYTLLSDGRYYSHATNRIIDGDWRSEHPAYRSVFEVLA